MNAGKEKVPPMELLYAELSDFLKTGKTDYRDVSPYLYHTISKNLDFYNYKQVTIDKNVRLFEIAYRATLFQIECGEELRKPIDPETLIEHKKDISPPSEAQKEKASEIIGGLLAMFDEDKPKPLTDAEKADLERLEKIRNGL